MDPKDLTANIISVATVAYDSSRAIYEIIKGYGEAANTFHDLQTDVESLANTLSSLREIGGPDQGASFSQSQLLCLKEVEPALQACSTTCKAFKSKIDKLMSNSTPGHISKRDKFMLQFQSNDISAFRIQLDSYKSTLTIALLVTSIKSSLTNEKELEVQIKQSITLLTGRLEGIRVAMQTIQDSGFENSKILEEMRVQARALTTCGNICTTAADAVAITGNIYKDVKAFGNARFVMGNTNTKPIAAGPSNVFERVTGDRDARIWMGNLDANTALDFMR